uniref:Uncharacterized protein n=1 Tax=Fopius arisanus TaxID=64838 RepID=A0A0C9PQH6_9HYME
MLLKSGRTLKKSRRHHEKIVKATAGNTGGGSAANSAQRASLAANTRQTTPRRFTQARSSQQSQQSVIQQQSSISQTSQRQHTSPARIPLASIAGVTVRNTDEHGPNSTQEVCDNSNDSGLGFEDRQQHITNPSVNQAVASILFTFTSCELR